MIKIKAPPNLQKKIMWRFLYHTIRIDNKTDDFTLQFKQYNCTISAFNNEFYLTFETEKDMNWFLLSYDDYV